MYFDCMFPWTGLLIYGRWFVGHTRHKLRLLLLPPVSRAMPANLGPRLTVRLVLAGQQLAALACVSSDGTRKGARTSAAERVPLPVVASASGSVERTCAVGPNEITGYEANLFEQSPIYFVPII